MTYRTVLPHTHICNPVRLCPADCEVRTRVCPLPRFYFVLLEKNFLVALSDMRGMQCHKIRLHNGLTPPFEGAEYLDIVLTDVARMVLEKKHLGTFFSSNEFFLIP